MHYQEMVAAMVVGLTGVALSTAAVQAAEPAKLQVELNVRPTARLHSHYVGYGDEVAFPGAMDDGGGMWSLQLLYNLNKQFTVGAGIGFSGENSSTFNAANAPIYGIVQWHPVDTYHPFYVMGELGYGIGHATIDDYTYWLFNVDDNGEIIDDSYIEYNVREYNGLQHGWYGAIGLGWRKQFRRHFGLNFQLGYMLRQYRHVYGSSLSLGDIPYYNGDVDIPNGFEVTPISTILNTGSLFFTVGIDL
jgi:hypothetical protein